MASINGISIKNLKEFKDHEGAPCFQGNIYHKNKKLGFWSQDSWGGPDSFDFDETILDEEVKRYAASDMVEEKYREFAGLDSLLCDVLELSDNEKSYKKGVKKGYNTYVMASDGYHVKGYWCNTTPESEIEKTSYYKNFVKECEKAFFKDWDCKNKPPKIFRSLDDFKIAV